MRIFFSNPTKMFHTEVIFELGDRTISVPVEVPIPPEVLDPLKLQPLTSCVVVPDIKMDPEWKPLQPGSTLTYLIQAGDTHHYKIGCSNDPKRRVRQLQTGNHLPLKIVALSPGGCKFEHDLHTLMGSARMRDNGEWFVLDPHQLRRVQYQMWLAREEEIAAKLAVGISSSLASGDIAQISLHVEKGRLTWQEVAVAAVNSGQLVLLEFALEKELPDPMAIVISSIRSANYTMISHMMEKAGLRLLHTQEFLEAIDEQEDSFIFGYLVDIGIKTLILNLNTAREKLAILQIQRQRPQEIFSMVLKYCTDSSLKMIRRYLLKNDDVVYFSYFALNLITSLEPTQPLEGWAFRTDDVEQASPLTRADLKRIGSLYEVLDSAKVHSATHIVEYLKKELGSLHFYRLEEDGQWHPYQGRWYTIPIDSHSRPELEHSSD